MMQVDERIAFEASGIATKKLTMKLTALKIQKHLDCFNLEMQFGTYSKISALSGGQKVKVVLPGVRPLGHAAGRCTRIRSFGAIDVHAYLGTCLLPSSCLARQPVVSILYMITCTRREIED